MTWSAYKNAEIQIDKFGQNALSFYVILDCNGNSIVTPHAFDLDMHRTLSFWMME